MVFKYLNTDGLRYLKAKIDEKLNTKADKSVATNSSNGLMSKEDYSKLHNLKKSDITDFPSTMPPSAHTHSQYLNKSGDTVTGGKFSLNENTVNLSGNTYNIDGSNRFDLTPLRGTSAVMSFTTNTHTSGLEVKFREAFPTLSVSKTGGDDPAYVDLDVDDVRINGNSMVISQETINLYRSLGME